MQTGLSGKKRDAQRAYHAHKEIDDITRMIIQRYGDVLDKLAEDD